MKYRIIGLMCFLTLAPSLFSQSGYAKGLSKQAKKQVEERYKKSKYEAGRIVWGADAGTFKEWGTVLVGVKRFPMQADRSLPASFAPVMVFDPVEVDIKDGEIVERGDYTHEVEPGTILAIYDLKIRDDRIELFCRTVNPHAIERGVGAFKDTYYENVSTKLRFFFNRSVMDSSNLTTVFSTIDEWVKPFDSYDEAIKVGNTVSGAFVKEIKLGMTFAEVESIFGVPQKKATLGNKVIYKYSDMTVEFVDGKVADVKF